MKIETRNNGLEDYTVLVADDGKWLRRKESGEVYGAEVCLGNSYYIGGEELEEPHGDKVEDFEEFDAPVSETTEDGTLMIEPI